MKSRALSDDGITLQSESIHYYYYYYTSHGNRPVITKHHPPTTDQASDPVSVEVSTLRYEVGAASSVQTTNSSFWIFIGTSHHPQFASCTSAFPTCITEREKRERVPNSVLVWTLIRKSGGANLDRKSVSNQARGQLMF